MLVTALLRGGIGWRGTMGSMACVIAGITFTTVETGLEPAAGIWGYVFLMSGRGLPAVVAGVAVSAY